MESCKNFIMYEKDKYTKKQKNKKLWNCQSHLQTEDHIEGVGWGSLICVVVNIWMSLTILKLLVVRWLFFRLL